MAEEKERDISQKKKKNHLPRKRAIWTHVRYSYYILRLFTPVVIIPVLTAQMWWYVATQRTDHLAPWLFISDPCPGVTVVRHWETVTIYRYSTVHSK